ncbi:hypothetical protein B296_00038207 [Ensete ventricosum]|uniref:Uncharacterized protein n=1 Tax=Ensete ventricosum TaxID=4639 RepID=A0A426XRH5_ENSVE|nr:hypothetical protein B296_00038207 [Ensete ventricosum]
MKLQPDDGPRSSLGIGSGLDNAMRSRRSSLRDSPKGSGSSLGTRRKIVERRPEDSPQECRRLQDWRECTTVAQAFGRLTRPGWVVKLPMQQPEDAVDAEATVTRQGNTVVCRTQVHCRGAPMMAVGIDETVFCCSELRPPASQREPR